MRTRGAARLAPVVLAALAVGGAFAASSDEPPSSEPGGPRPLPRSLQDRGDRLVRLEDGMEVLRIPPGRFRMGDDQGPRNRRPAHEVTISRGFYVDRHEVTVRQFETVMGTGPKAIARLDEHPVVGVSWADADRYCRKVGGRLPTEAEWEYAARGGLAAKKYPWGDQEVCSSHGCLANFGGPHEGFSGTAPVGSFPSNRFGLCDMAGNAEEWVADWYDRRYYRRSPAVDPKGPDKGSYRVLRGGGFRSSPSALNVAERNFGDPKFWILDPGFRCVVDE